MSVPAYKRRVSRTEYIQKLAEMNDFLRRMVFRAPKKYREAYGDALLQNGLQAYLNAYDANDTSIRKGDPAENYDRRIELLQSVLRYMAHVEYISQLFTACREDIDGAERTKLNKQREKIGTYRAQIDALVKNNIKFVRNKKKEDFS